MGNINSAPIQTFQKQIDLTIAKNNALVAQTVYDDLMPAEAIQRKKKEADKITNRYINSINPKFSKEVELHHTLMEGIVIIENSPTTALAKEYAKLLPAKYAEKQQQNHIHKENYILNRRRFLDSNPSKLVYGWSMDDRIMLCFWICFLIFIIPVSYYLIQMTGLPNKNIIWPTSVIVGLLLVHYAIRFL